MTAFIAHNYSLFSRSLCTNTDFSASLLESSGNDLEFIVNRQVNAPEYLSGKQVFPPQHLTGGHYSLQLVKAGKLLRVKYRQSATYDISENKNVCYPHHTMTGKKLKLNFLGPLMSLWLEQNGFRVLHASAVLINQKVALFLADSRQGKSTWHR